MDRPEDTEEPATAWGRWAAREPTDGWAGGTGTSELGCWLMDLFFRVFGSLGASEPWKNAEEAGAGGEPRSLAVRGRAELAASREGRKAV